MLPDLYRFDSSVSPNRKSAESRIIQRFAVVFPSAMDHHVGKWRVLSSSYPISTPFLRLRSDVIELPGGDVIHDYYVRESNGFAVMFALTSDERVVLVRQYKHGAGRSVLELPAGAMDAGETASVCAQRELAEETGHIGDEPEHIGSYLADPTNSNASFHLYLIRNAQPRVAQKLDRTEEIDIEFASPLELRAMVRDGRINTGSQVACVYAALEYVGLLPR